ncbi:hypothetical protein GZH46_00404 [Fragariocoptes setiger]|uniref:Carboxylesterase type B domain-containing protein n=1 Tax=Fragariocoptes setiger TaxID=1670756 RepID=A0ABQ7SC84_9ACAR|nr:hypothetical protein GZH46_00404 [Fragariocoptes setiger]
MKQPIDTTPTIAGLVPVLLHLYVILSMISQVAVAAPSQIYKNNDEQHQHQRQVQVLMLHSNAPNSHNQTTTSLLEPSQLATHLIVDRSDILSKSSTNSTSDRHINNNNSNSEYDAPQLSALRLYGHESITSSDATNFQQPKDNQPSPAQPMPHVSEVTMTKFRPTWYSANRFNDLISSNAQTSSVNGSNVRAVPMLANMVPGDYIQQKAFDSPILLRTRLGVIEGVRSIRLGQKRLYTFLSIPYAKPPIGERRFAAPEPVEPWQGILQATSWPPFCVQTSMTLASRKSPVHVISTHMNEDCLYLNVWTPTLKYRKGRNRPVMVWLHGGAFQYGGISVSS